MKTTKERIAVLVLGGLLVASVALNVGQRFRIRTLEHLYGQSVDTAQALHGGYLKLARLVFH